MVLFNRFIKNKQSFRFISGVIVFVGFALVMTIALLIWNLAIPKDLNNKISQKHIICPPNPCPSSIGTTSSLTSMTSSVSFTSTNITHISITTTTSSLTQSTSVEKRTYKESCGQLFDCHIEYGLYCEYGWNEDKICLCEGSHYWSAQKNKCLRKGEINGLCETDHQCHREIGLVCDKPPDSSRKICICAASFYWAKDSNCGQTTVRHIVDCIDEDVATTCLVLGTNNIYHMVTIRSITENEISFDWFLIDNRVLEDLPQLSCAINNETRYCFGLSVQDSQHPLKLAQFTRKGFHSIENIGGNNRGTAFGLTNTDSVAVFVRNSQNTLFRRIIADDEILSARDITSSLSGDPMCYIYKLLTSQNVYCFARNSARGLNEYVELTRDTWQVTQLGSPTDRIRDETAPVCSYVGQIYRYCFSVFENEQIYRITWKSGVWGTWQPIGQDRTRQFITQPAFLTSKPLDESSSDQICYLLAIDTNNNLQVSINLNCAESDNFSEWTSISTSLKFTQADKIFRLHDGNVGLLSIDNKNQLYYLLLDPINNRFLSPRPAFTTKSNEFRP